MNIYDKASYLAALNTPGASPLQVGTYEVRKGERIFKPLVT
jgi:hypothetical protein